MPVQGVSTREILVTLTPESELAGKVLEDSTTVSTGPEVVVHTETVPGGKTWRVRYAEVVCRGAGRWKLVLDGIRIAGGLTSSAREHDRVDLPGYVEAAAGGVLEVKYTYSHGPAGIDLDSFIGVTEI